VAWSIYRTVATRFVWDGHAAGWALDRLTRDWPVEDVTDLLDRLAVLYDALQPPPQT